MQHKPAVGLYLDTRRPVQSGKFPVKIRVTWQTGKRKYTPKYFHTQQFLSPDEFDTVIKGKARSGHLRDSQALILTALNKAQDIVNKNHRVTIDQFTLLFNGSFSNTGIMGELFDEIIEEKKKAGKVGSANSYLDSKTSLVKYAGGDIHLSDVNESWLKAYETYMVSKGASLNTVGFYLRSLRAVYNRAIDRKIISAELYPFGKKGFHIRKKRVKKKAIPVDIKDRIINYTPESGGEAAALDYILFSYYCNGMNFTDMAYLRSENFKSDHFVFIRRKTMNTVKEQREIKVYLSAPIKKILKRRGTHSSYIFGIITDNMDEETRKKKIKQWIKTTNGWAKRIAKNIGYKDKITTYSMRHTFTTMLVNAGIPLTKVKDSLGHTSIVTMQNYAEDLDLETSKKFHKIL